MRKSNVSKRKSRDSQKKRAGRAAHTRAPSEAGQSRRHLRYKVVELSNVDEGALERTLNEWVPQGWAFDGVQFAMRESSKRPSMAFVFLTREEEASHTHSDVEGGRTQDDAVRHLRRIAHEHHPVTAAAPISAYERLRQLAEGDE